MWIDIYTCLKCNPQFVHESERKWFSTCSEYLHWIMSNYPNWYDDYDDQRECVFETVDEYSHIRC